MPELATPGGYGIRPMVYQPMPAPTNYQSVAQSIADIPKMLLATNEQNQQQRMQLAQMDLQDKHLNTEAARWASMMNLNQAKIDHIEGQSVAGSDPEHDRLSALIRQNQGQKQGDQNPPPTRSAIFPEGKASDSFLNGPGIPTSTSVSEPQGLGIVASGDPGVSIPVAKVTLNPSQNGLGGIVAQTDPSSPEISGEPISNLPLESVSETVPSSPAAPDQNAAGKAIFGSYAPSMSPGGLSTISPSVASSWSPRNATSPSPAPTKDSEIDLSAIRQDPITGNIFYKDPDGKTWMREHGVKGWKEMKIDPSAGSSGPDEAMLNEDATTKMLANYKLPLQALSRFTPATRERIYANAMKVNPDFNAAEYLVRQKTMDSFTSGDAAKQIRTLNSTISHFGQVLDTAKALPQGSPWYNKGTNMWNTSIKGTAAEKNFSTARGNAIDMMVKYMTGGVPNEGEKKKWEDIFSSANSPEQLQGAVNQAIIAMQDQTETLKDQWKEAFGSPYQKIFLNQRSNQILKNAGIDTTKIDDTPAATPNKSSGGSTTMSYGDPDVDAILADVSIPAAQRVQKAKDLIVQKAASKNTPSPSALPSPRPSVTPSR